MKQFGRTFRLTNAAALGILEAKRIETTSHYGEEAKVYDKARRITQTVLRNFHRVFTFETPYRYRKP